MNNNELESYYFQIDGLIVTKLRPIVTHHSLKAVDGFDGYLCFVEESGCWLVTEYDVVSESVNLLPHQRL